MNNLSEALSCGILSNFGENKCLELWLKLVDDLRKHAKRHLSKDN